MTTAATAKKTGSVSGRFIVIALIFLTAVVGSLFIYLGPKATEKSPGILHVGIRYANENTLEFAQYGKKGPGARIEFIASDNSVSYFVDDLIIGRNLVPIIDLIDGLYTARLSAKGFRTVTIPMIAQGRMLNPPKGIQFDQGTYADYNMIGVRFEPR